MLKKIKKIIAAFLILGAFGTGAKAVELSPWAQNDFINANLAQLIPFSVGARSMCGNITREQLCELIVNTYEKITDEKIPEYPLNPFSDCDNQTVINAYGSGLVGGTGESTFSPDNLVTREELAKMLYNMLLAADLNIKFSLTSELDKSVYEDTEDISEWARPAVATVINQSLMNGVEGKLLPTGNATREQAIAAASRAYEAFKKNDRKMAEIITVLSPSEGEVVPEGDVTVTWNPIIDADFYKVFIRNSNGELIVNDVIYSTSHTIVKSMFEQGAYNVSIEAVMKNGSEIFSVPTGFYYKSIQPQSLILGTSKSFKHFGDNAERKSQITASDNYYKTVDAIFAEGEKHIGTPYRYGGTTPAGFDCSGFVQYVFNSVGIKLKRTSRDQYANNGYYISKEELRPGDLVFFGSGGTVGHVGIYAGDGHMLHSPSTGKSIMYTSIETNYYISHYIGAKRIIE